MPPGGIPLYFWGRLAKYKGEDEALVQSDIQVLKAKLGPDVVPLGRSRKRSKHAEAK